MRPPARSLSRSRRAPWLALAAAGLGLAWLAAPVAPPLYDGVGFPDEAYRYVTRPAGVTQATKPPTGLTASMPVVDGTTDGFNSASAEQGPQISVFVPTGTLRAPKGANLIQVRAEPRAPDGPADGGRVDGNIYRLTARSDVGKPTLAAVQDKVEVIMRATSARQPGPVMEYRPLNAQDWTRLPTTRYGSDVYAAVAKGFGDYALVFAKPAPGRAPSPTAGRLGKYAYLLIIAGLVILLGAVVLGIRLARARRAAAQP